MVNASSGILVQRCSAEAHSMNVPMDVKKSDDRYCDIYRAAIFQSHVKEKHRGKISDWMDSWRSGNRISDYLFRDALAFIECWIETG
jgi:hypothetical protein